jgi:hypothetical protein
MNEPSVVIHTMLRDEDNLIKDFILHHITLGFKHIYIHDDNSKIPVKEHVNELPNDVQQKITVIRIDFDILNEKQLKENNFYDDDIFQTCGEYKQRYLQTYFTKLYNKVAEWCYYCDVDEFIYLKNDVTIFDVINKYNTYDSIYIPWLMFGSSYYFEQPNGSVIDTFKFHADKYNFAGKSIVRLSSVKNIPFLSTHLIHKPNSYIMDYFDKPYDANNDIHICHYNIQSIQTYLKRKMRHEIGTKGGHMISIDSLLSNLVSYNDIIECDMSKYSKQQFVHNDNNDVIKKQFPLVYSCDGKIFATYNKRSQMYFITAGDLSHDDMTDIMNKKKTIKISYEYDLFGGNEIEKFINLNQGFKMLKRDDIMYMYINMNPSCVL